MNIYPDKIGRLALAAFLAAAIGLSVLSNAGAYPVDPGPIPPTCDVIPEPTSSTYASPSTVVKLYDRIVRLVDIATHRLGYMPDVGICCSTDGKTVDLSSVTGSNAVAQIAVDASGRLWLTSEAFNTLRHPSHQTRIVQLDTQTLEPSGTVQTVPGLKWSTIEAIACGSTCRLIVEGRAAAAARAGLFAWAPGDVTPTELQLPGAHAARPAHVLAARDDADQLVIVYSMDEGTGRPVTITLARGDASGNNFRVVSSTHVPQHIRGAKGELRLTSPVIGTLGANGFTAKASYSGKSGKAKTRVVVLAA